MKNKEKFFIFIFFTYKKREKTSENYHIPKYNNRSVYKDRKDCRKVTLLIILQRYLAVITSLRKFIYQSARKCMEIIILDEEVEY
jgi:hypothetical protein